MPFILFSREGSKKARNCKKNIKLEKARARRFQGSKGSRLEKNRLDPVLFLEWILRRGCVKTDLENSEEKNKNRRSSTSCGKELQKIFNDWQSVKGLYQKVPKRFTDLSDLCFWPFLTSKWAQKSNLTWSAQHNLGVPKIFIFKKISVWALLRP